MFARIEVAVRPDLQDSKADRFLRQVELANPWLRRRIRWARFLEVYWIDIPTSREELIPAITEVCWDRVLQWVFTGNLMPSAAGKTGGLQDLMQLAPHRPGKFWGIERRFRGGVSDHVGRVLLEAFEIVLERKLPQARASSGSLLVLEGLELEEEALAFIAKEVFCNELLQTWTILPEEGFKKNDRFHQERVKQDLPKVLFRGSDQVETISMNGLSDLELSDLGQQRLLGLSLQELKAIRNHFKDADPTDVELEIIAKAWSESNKHKVFNSKVRYRGANSEKNSEKIPEEIDGLFKSTILEVTQKLAKPWLFSGGAQRAGLMAFDEEDAFCFKVEAHHAPSALDPFGGSLTGMLGVNRRVLGCGLGAQPLFNTSVFCGAPPNYEKDLPDRVLHPRRILSGVRAGVEQAGNQCGIPSVNGAFVFDERYLENPLVYCGAGGFLPRKLRGEATEVKRVSKGDRICMVGGAIGKDGLAGSPLSAGVQLGDSFVQKRMSDFLMEARNMGFYRAIVPMGIGGLACAVGEMAQTSGGAYMDVSLAKVKYPGMKPHELVMSESQERMAVAVPPTQLAAFLALAERRSVDVSDLGEFTESGRFEVAHAGKMIASLDLKFLHQGVPKPLLAAEWKGQPEIEVPGSEGDYDSHESFAIEGSKVLLDLLGRPTIASKESFIRQTDHEVQGMSVVKPLHTAGVGTSTAWSGPNDAGVLKPKVNSDMGLAVGCGIQPRLSDVDPFLMAQAAADEAIRNVLCVGAEFGHKESVIALIDHFSWPDPVGDAFRTAWLVRACYGLKDAALALGVPLVSDQQSLMYSGPPTLLMTAVARVQDIKNARTSDFKNPGDGIYLLGGADFGLLGSECLAMAKEAPTCATLWGGPLHVGKPNWKVAQKTYSWLGGSVGKTQGRLKSLHDISEGGLLVAISECLLARGLGAKIQIPTDRNAWEFMFGEGFHGFVGSVAEGDIAGVESEWADAGVPFIPLGKVESQDRLEVWIGGEKPLFTAKTSQMRAAWSKEGYWG